MGGGGGGRGEGGRGAEKGKKESLLQRPESPSLPMFSCQITFCSLFEKAEICPKRP